MRPRRIFVSYTERNEETRTFAGNLLKRLNDHEHGLAWNYRSLDGDLTVGSEIRRGCEQEIERATLFVALVTAEAQGSAIVRHEVSFALARAANDHLAIAPVVLLAHLKGGIADLCHPFDALRDRKLVELATTDEDSLETLLAHLVPLTGLTYVPPHPDLEVLPLISRTFNELAQLAVAGQSQAGLLDVVRRMLTDVSMQYAQRNLSVAREKMGAAVQLIKTLYPSAALAFPEIVLVVLDIEQAGPGDLPEVIELSLGKLREMQKRIHSDANLLAAIGYLEQARGNHAAALEAYRSAERMDPHDPDIAYNIMVSLVNAGMRDEGAVSCALLQVFESGLATRSQSDYFRFLGLRILWALHCREAQSFVDRIAMLPTDWHGSADVVLKILELVQARPEMQVAEEAERMALACLSNYSMNDPLAFAVRHRLAHLWMAHGLKGPALAYLDRLTADHPCHPMPVVDSAVFEYAQRRTLNDSTRRKLHWLVSSLKVKDVLPPLSRTTFDYYIGLAYHLLDMRAEATVKFADSGYEECHAYRAVLARLTIPKLN